MLVGSGCTYALGSSRTTQLLCRLTQYENLTLGFLHPKANESGQFDFLLEEKHGNTHRLQIYQYNHEYTFSGARSPVEGREDHTGVRYRKWLGKLECSLLSSGPTEFYVRNMINCVIGVEWEKI